MASERILHDVRHVAASSRDLRVIGAGALALLFLWATIDIDFVIFAGILLAIFLHGLAALVARRGRLGRGWSLALTVALLAVLILGVAYLFAEAIIGQANQLSIELGRAADHLRAQVQNWPLGHDLLSNMKPQKMSQTMMSGGALGGVFGIASNAVTLIGGVVVTLFFGIYLSAEPGPYLRGLVKLFPPRWRGRAREILAGVGDVLWYWMLGRLFSMSVVGLFTTAGLWVLGMPLPFALGGLAGVLTFVPYIGAIVSAIPSLIIALSISPRQALWTALLYVAVHILEGYILVPLVQRRAAHVPPAMTLAAQLILGTLAGIIGVTFATPLTAATIYVIRKAYVEDTLGDGRTPEA